MANPPILYLLGIFTSACVQAAGNDAAAEIATNSFNLRMVNMVLSPFRSARLRALFPRPHSPSGNRRFVKIKPPENKRGKSP
jgi:hypothetical protein